MQAIVLLVKKVIRRDSDCILVYLETIHDKPLFYRAGQFLTLLIKIHGREIRRSYSLFTNPAIDDGMAIVIKRVANGEVSRYLVDNLVPGDKLEALPPAGRFILPESYRPEQVLVFIAAGGGISPVYGLIKEALLVRLAERVLLIYQNRNEQQALFLEELKNLERSTAGRLSLIELYSNPRDPGHAPARLNNTLLEERLKIIGLVMAEGFFYLCGPPAFMRTCQFVLRTMGVPGDLIFKEKFFVESAPVLPPLRPQKPQRVHLKWRESMFSFEVEYPETILMAALRAGVMLPYSCRGGRCSTCAVICTNGRVVMSINEVLTDRDLRAGFVLTCVGYPETDLELELPG